MPRPKYYHNREGDDSRDRNRESSTNRAKISMGFRVDVSMTTSSSSYRRRSSRRKGLSPSHMPVRSERRHDSRRRQHDRFGKMEPPPLPPRVFNRSSVTRQADIYRRPSDSYHPSMLNAERHPSTAHHQGTLRPSAYPSLTPFTAAPPFQFKAQQDAFWPANAAAMGYPQIGAFIQGASPAGSAAVLVSAAPAGVRTEAFTRQGSKRRNRHKSCSTCCSSTTSRSYSSCSSTANPSASSSSECCSSDCSCCGRRSSSQGSSNSSSTTAPESGVAGRGKRRAKRISRKRPNRKSSAREHDAVAKGPNKSGRTGRAKKRKRTERDPASKRTVLAEEQPPMNEDQAVMTTTEGSNAEQRRSDDEELKGLLERRSAILARLAEIEDKMRGKATGQ